MLARGADSVLDACVIGLASWTLSYQLCLITRWGARTAAVVAAVVAISTLLALRLVRDRESEGESAPDAAVRRAGRRWHLFVVPVPIVAAALFAFSDGPWRVVWSVWFLAALLGLFVAHQRWAVATTAHRFGAGGWFVVALAGAASYLSLVVLRPDLDDVHYVHLSTWIAQHGRFPLRDTLFGDQSLPALYWPPIDSYPALNGTIGMLLGISAPTVVYLVVPPIATTLAVLAMWRLMRAWKVPAPALAVGLGLVFLLWDAQTGFRLDYPGTWRTTAGNFFLARMWQGKVVFCCLAVPLLYVYLQRYVTRPDRRTLVLLVAVSVASVGLTTSAVFVVPLLALGALAPVAFRLPWRALAGCAAAAGYPLSAGVVILAVDGHTPDRYVKDQIRSDQLAHFVLGAGAFGALGLLAALLAWRMIGDPVGRVMAAGAALLAAIVYAPGVGDLIYDVTGLTRTQWRLMWILPLGSLVGALAVGVANALRGRTMRYAAVVAIGVVFATAGTSIWSTTNQATIAAPRWKMWQVDIDDAADVARITGPGDVVLIPERTALALAVTDAKVAQVSPRALYTGALHDHPGGYAEERMRLQSFADNRLDPLAWATLQADIRLLGVDLVCVRPASAVRNDDLAAAAATFLHDHGFTAVLHGRDLVCYVQRPGGQPPDDTVRALSSGRG